jgi:pimeloyl-ACP methyl ester carboxylesterase
VTTTHTLDTSEAAIVYDVHGPLPTEDECPPLFMIGQTMTAVGFGALASHFRDRTIVTYDPRGLGRSTRKDGVEEFADGPGGRPARRHRGARRRGPPSICRWPVGRASSGEALWRISCASGTKSWNKMQ